jgi:hypothetical protein
MAHIDSLLTISRPWGDTLTVLRHSPASNKCPWVTKWIIFWLIFDLVTPEASDKLAASKLLVVAIYFRIHEILQIMIYAFAVHLHTIDGTTLNPFILSHPDCLKTIFRFQGANLTPLRMMNES